ncbi:MAG: methyltransferase domain-containing protein [Methanobacterium sp.]|uniref:methyltransferase domain-containing protein n=1 Tax=Methanobacterium sp. TaxID=2164 RepID=UPI003D659F0F|nr:methyltransferase domain-containing protein [Methanobacterium sp.]
MDNFDQAQKEYSEDFCTLLEEAYGKGFLSEGGSEAIDHSVKGFQLDNKKILDIGSGLGGAAIHFAGKYNAIATGVEINEMMVDEANRRVPEKLTGRVKFLYYDDINHLPFLDEYFHLVYSKEVFLHLDVEDKLILFKEIYRILKNDSYFIIVDWLSPVKDHWGNKLKEMMRLDGITLFANTEEDYSDVLRQARFKIVSIDEESEKYAQYNKEIINHLKKDEIQNKLKGKFSDKEIQDNILAYSLLYDSLKEKELFIRRIICKK